MPSILQTNYGYNQFTPNTGALYVGTLLNFAGQQFNLETAVNTGTNIYPSAPVQIKASNSQLNSSTYANGINATMSQSGIGLLSTTAPAPTNASITGFMVSSVLDIQATSTGDQVPSAPLNNNFDFVRLNSGANIVVPITTALSTLFATAGVVETTPVSWNFTAITSVTAPYGALDVGTTNLLPVSILSVQKGWIPLYVNGLQTNWSLGNVAVIKLSRIQLPQTA